MADYWMVELDWYELNLLHRGLKHLEREMIAPTSETASGFSRSITIRHVYDLIHKIDGVLGEYRLARSPYMDDETFGFTDGTLKKEGNVRLMRKL